MANYLSYLSRCAAHRLLLRQTKDLVCLAAPFRYKFRFRREVWTFWNLRCRASVTRYVACCLRCPHRCSLWQLYIKLDYPGLFFFSFFWKTKKWINIIFFKMAPRSFNSIWSHPMRTTILLNNIFQVGTFILITSKESIHHSGRGIDSPIIVEEKEAASCPMIWRKMKKIINLILIRRSMCGWLTVVILVCVTPAEAPWL